ncbi:MAG TPA: hypothetical protein VFJ16_18980 [Longimicrobium sp.]|nr:hypothetical protein [Longimicrobium sp.]
MRPPELLHGPADPPAGRRLLLISYHFPPGQATGALRWQKLAAYAAARGWSIDALCAHPDELASTDRPRLAELPACTRVYGVRTPGAPLPAFARRSAEGALDALLSLRRRPGDRAGDGGEGGRDGAAPAAPDLVYREEMENRVRPRALLRAWRARRYFAMDAAWARAAGQAALAIADRSRHAAVVSCGPPHMPHVAAARVARRLRLPYVMDMRDPWSRVPALPSSMASPAWYRLAERFEREAVEAAAVVSANTLPARDALRELYPAAAQRVIAVMNGCDDEAVPPPVRDGAFVVAYSGNIYIDRDPRPFFRAAAAFARTHGLGPERFGIELVGHVDAFGGIPVARLAADAGVGAHVRVLARRPRAEALRVLARASVLLSLPQDVELAIPSKIFEYMQFPAWILALARRGSATERLLRGTAADVVDPADQAGVEAALHRRWAQFVRGEPPRPLNADGRFGRAAQAALLFDALDAAAGVPAARPSAGRAA